MWIRKVIKIGTALGVVVPASICRALDIKRGDYLLIKLLEDSILTVSKYGDSEADKILGTEKQNGQQ